MSASKTMRSARMKSGLEKAPHRSLFYALGLTREEITRLRADQQRQKSEQRIDQLMDRSAASSEVTDGSEQSGSAGTGESAASSETGETA